MTSTPQQHRPNRVRPRTVQNRIHWVLGQHGIHVNMQTVESIYHSLTTGNDPRPSGIPAQFTFQGVKVVWPAGVGRRLLHPAERRTLNEALALNGNELLDSEDRADEGRRAYMALWHKTQQPDYDDPTSTTARMNALVEEATSGERLLTEISTGSADGEYEFHGTVDDLTDRASALIQKDGVLCGHRKPHGRLLCLEDNHHAGLHRNGKHTWTETEVVKIQHATTNKRSVKAQTPKRDDDHELDDLLAQLESLNNLTANL